jgi:hypothetical protein
MVDQHRHALDRFSVPLAQKMSKIDQVFDILASSGRQAVTMAGLARHWRDRLGASKEA